MKNIIFYATVVILAAACQPATVSVSDATMPSAAAGRTTAAYMTIRNGTNAAIRITGIEAPFAGSAELHSMSMQNDIMRMEHLDSLEVPAGGKVLLEPGGIHLMLYEVDKEYPAGERLKINLLLSDGQKLAVDLLVTAPL